VPYHVPGAVDGDELELVEGHRVAGLVQRVLGVGLGQPLVPVSVVVNGALCQCTVVKSRSAV
jgi:hypothetical protein